MPAKISGLLKQENDRQGTWNQQQIVEPETHEVIPGMRPNQKPICSIQPATRQKQRIGQIAKPLHKSAKMRRPTDRANNTFKTKTAMPVFKAAIQIAQEPVEIVDALLLSHRICERAIPLLRSAFPQSPAALREGFDQRSRFHSQS